MNKRTAGWLISNGTFAIALYFGLTQGVNGAWNLVQFYIGFCLSTSLLYFNGTVQKTVRGKNPPVPASIDLPLDIFFTGVLVWFGHPVLGLLYLIHTLLLHGAYASPSHSVPEHPADKSNPSSTE